MADEDARWMSFQALAALRGTSKRAAVMLVRRHKWPRQTDNQGHTLALVPATWLVPKASDQSDDIKLNVPDHVAPNGTDHAVQVLEQALQALREAHSAERALLQGQIGELRTSLEQANAAARTAQQAADDLRRADEQRRARGRLRAAWHALRGV